MALAFQPGSPPADELRRVLLEQTDLAIDALTTLDREKAVHETRKACKRVRAVLRLARRGGTAAPARWLNGRYRDAAALLGPIRDADVVPKTVARLGGKDLAMLAARLEERHPADVDERMAEALSMLRANRTVVASEPFTGFDDSVLFAGFQDGYRAARAGMLAAIADSDPHVVHEWRKRAKAHFFHLQVVELAWPPVVGALVKVADDLQETLGDHHDCAVLRDAAAECEADLRARADELAQARETELLAAALVLGKQLFVVDAARQTRWVYDHWIVACEARSP